MGNTRDLDDENPPADAPRIAPVLAPRLPSRRASSSVLSPHPSFTEETAPPLASTRTGPIFPTPTSFALDDLVISTAPETTGKAASETPAAPVLAPEPTTRSPPKTTENVYIPAPISDTPASPPISVHVYVPTSTEPVNSQKTPPAPTTASGYTSTTPPKPEKPPTREQPAPAPAPKVQDTDKDNHKLGNGVAEAATIPAPRGFGVVVVNLTLPVGNGDKDEDNHKVGNGVAEAATIPAPGGSRVVVVDHILPAGNGNDTTAKPGGSGSCGERCDSCWGWCKKNCCWCCCKD